MSQKGLNATVISLAFIAEESSALLIAHWYQKKPKSLKKLNRSGTN